MKEGGRGGGREGGERVAKYKSWRARVSIHEYTLVIQMACLWQ